MSVCSIAIFLIINHSEKMATKVADDAITIVFYLVVTIYCILFFDFYHTNKYTHKKKENSWKKIRNSEFKIDRKEEQKEQ